MQFFPLWYGLYGLSCTAIKSLNEAHLFVGNDWTEGSIALGSHFLAGIQSGGIGEGIDIKSSDSEVLQPSLEDPGRSVFLTAIKEGSAEVQAVNKDGVILDSVAFTVITATDIQMIDHQGNVIPSEFAGLVDTYLYLIPDLLDADGNSLWHSSLVETTDYEREILYTSLESGYLKLMLDSIGQQEMGIQASDLDETYTVHSIEELDLSTFSFEVVTTQEEHPDEEVYAPADYQYVWVEILIDAKTSQDVPVLIPSTDLYVTNAQSTWSPEEAINHVWAMVSEDELPDLSLTSNDDNSSGTDLEIPEHNQ